jgi:hypothetical protein
MVISVSLLQPLKALSPILLTLSEILMLPSTMRSRR